MNYIVLYAQENYERTLKSRGSKVRVIGWINDLSYFHHLESLSLSDNRLDQFPVSLCTVHTLQVLTDTHTHTHTHTHGAAGQMWLPYRSWIYLETRSKSYHRKSRD